MNVLIKSATILDDKSDFHNQTQDILLENGFITEIANSLKNPNKYPIISLENLHVSSGWFDSSVSFGEPGFEERETLSNGLEVAAGSGFTDVAFNSNTYPVIDSHSDISFVISKSSNATTKLHPIGALTNESKGVDLAELFDMKAAGSIAFGDYKKPIKNAELLKIGLQYAQRFNGLIVSNPTDMNIGFQGGVHEGEISTRNGLLGSPSLSEILQIQRDVAVLEYTGGKLHIPFVSSAEGVELIRKAKKQGLNLSCSVALANLVFTDEELIDFDTLYKLDPPLRTAYDRTALRQAVIDGTIDLVTSNHEPLNIELKHLEFDFANSGTTGLEAMYGVLSTLFPEEKVIAILTKGK